MKTFETNGHFSLSVLVVAVVATMTGCATTPPTQTAPSVVRPNTNNSYPASNTTTVSKSPATDNQYEASQALLDEESLNELERLLEATDMKMVEDDKLAIDRMGNLWDRTRQGFSMLDARSRQNPRVLAQKNWFVTRQTYINNLTARASRYLYFTVREAERRGIPTELALLPVIESSYDPTATSNANAAGLWQFIPDTGAMYGLVQTPQYDGRRDVIKSTQAAYDFLTMLYNQFGSWELALAAYNTGPNNVKRAIAANQAKGLSTDFWSLNLPKETMNYVPRLLAVAQVVEDAQKHGVYLPAIANRQHFRSVPVQHGVTLQAVSQLTGVSLEELKALNPALTALRVDPAGEASVVIPNQVGTHIDEQLQRLTPSGYIKSVDDDRYATEVLSSSDKLAEFAANAGTPLPNAVPSAPVVNTAPLGTQTTTQTRPVPSTPSNTSTPVYQEPPIRPEEIAHIRREVNLEDIETQQNILQKRGEEKELTYASSSNRQPVAKPAGKRTIYTVQKRDTLINIANRAGLDWRDIARWNQMDANDTLLVGSKLYLYGAKPIAPLASQNGQANSASTNKPDYYVVQDGDTLIGTAYKFGLTPSELARYNNLATDAMLIRNTKLWLVPNQGKNKATTTTASAKSGSQATKQNTRSDSQNSTYQGVTSVYVVQPNDTLIGIAKKLSVTPEQIAQLNNIKADAYLIRNQKLVVPATANKVALHLKDEPIKYAVKEGDTLTGVAARFGVSLSDLATANGLTTRSNLIRDTKIIIPNASFTDSRSSASKTDVNPNQNTASTVATSQTSEPSFTDVYSVKDGDTLLGLANRFDVKVSQLARANGLPALADIRIGQKLKVPASNSTRASTSAKEVQRSATSDDATKAQPATAAANSELRAKKTTYTVVQGDNLTRLAKRFGLSLSQLAAANNLPTTAEVRINQVLDIPANVDTYRVQRGDSLIGLAKRFGITPAELAQMNGLSADAMLRREQTIYVPLR